MGIHWYESCYITPRSHCQSGNRVNDRRIPLIKVGPARNEVEMEKLVETKKVEKERAMTQIKVMVTNYLSSFSDPKDLDCFLSLKTAKA